MATLKWGTYTWLIFHGIAEKINIKYFDEERKNIINFIKQICSVLPCPKCKEHAKLSMVNIDSIKTKDDLISFLYDFHNKVNARRDIKNFDKSNLSIYKTIQLPYVITVWTRVFKVEGHIDNLINIDMFRQKVVNNFVSYMKTNLYKFN